MVLFLIISGKKNPTKKWGKTHRDTHKLYIRATLKHKVQNNFIIL